MEMGAWGATDKRQCSEPPVMAWNGLGVLPGIKAGRSPGDIAEDAEAILDRFLTTR
jgi:hypothetical protein